MKVDPKIKEQILVEFQKKKEVQVAIKGTRQQLEEKGLTVVHEFTNLDYPLCTVVLKSKGDIKKLEEDEENLEVLYAPEYHIL